MDSQNELKSLFFGNQQSASVKFREDMSIRTSFYKIVILLMHLLSICLLMVIATSLLA